MREFETFVYLDMQKTGSTFITTFLKQNTLEKLLRHDRHVGMPSDCDRSKLYFISVRNPLDQYTSLYSFGCQSLGQLHLKLDRRGRGSLYNGTWSGFESWLDFVLDPENARLLGDGYGRKRSGRASELVGLQSYRVLLLALPGAKELLHDCDSVAAIESVYDQHKLPEHVIRTETLRPDLKELVLVKLTDRFPDVAAALHQIDTMEPVNASKRIDQFDATPKLSAALQRRLEEREWLLHKYFGY